MHHRFASLAHVLVWVVALALPLNAGAADPCSPDHPNIVLFIADDLGWADIPFFSLPIETDVSSMRATRADEVQRPDLNRFAARALAGPDGLSFSPLTGTELSAIDKPATVPYAELCSTASCLSPERDILHGHGGLRRIAEGGLSFDRFYAASAVCSPSRASIFTGRHVGSKDKSIVALGQHDSKDVGKALPEHEVTIAEYLKQGCPGAPCFDPAGCTDKPCYDTALIGKWHLGGGQHAPQAQGFDLFVGFLGGKRGYFSDERLQCHVPPSYETVSNPWPPCVAGRMAVPQTRSSRQQDLCYADDLEVQGDGCNFSERLYRNHAIKFLRDRPNTGNPFFLVVAFHGVHADWVAPQRTTDHYRTGQYSLPGQIPAKKMSVVPRQPNGHASFWALVEEIDAAVGQIMDSLPPNTAVFFVSDNGRPSVGYGNPRLRGGKGGLAEGGVRMGLLARAPRDASCNAGPPSYMHADGYVAGHVDLFPTIADLAGVPLKPTTACGAEPCLFALDPSGEPCDPTQPNCIKHVIKGKSFKSLLRVNGATPTPLPSRDFIVSRYREGDALMTRSGAFGYGECSAGAQGVPVPLYVGSCQSCTSDDQCATALCRSAGSVCVTRPNGHCANSAGPTPITCISDGDCDGAACLFDPADIAGSCGRYVGCPPGQYCRVVRLNCNRCVDAAWKLKRSKRIDTALYNLNTNPSEEASLNCLAFEGTVAGHLDFLAERELEFITAP